MRILTFIFILFCSAFTVEASDSYAYRSTQGKQHDDVSEVRKSFIAYQKDSLVLDEVVLRVDEGVLVQTTEFSIQQLKSGEVRILSSGMVNVTAGSSGFRFLPHGEHFKDKGAEVILPYDPLLLPAGYDEEDIRTYYYDERAALWMPLERVSIDKTRKVIVSRTSHFTDMINGVIQTPEMPANTGYTPTMMSDMQAALPTNKIVVAQPPLANQKGTAEVTIPIQVPPVRFNILPNLSLRYNSDISDGWLGEGWDLSVSSISVDTRWGVPRYLNDSESESYLLDGEPLCMKDEKGTMTSVQSPSTKLPREQTRQFFKRNLDFSEILRKGELGHEVWTVTTDDGRTYDYGRQGACLVGTVSRNGGELRQVCSEWYLSSVADAHGVTASYEYEPVFEEVGGLPSMSVYLKQINVNDCGMNAVTIQFYRKKGGKSIRRSSARYGFMTSSHDLLDSIVVINGMKGETLWTYSFEYKQGAFHKDLLSSVLQTDKYGDTLTYHHFDYYDDLLSCGSEGLYSDENKIPMVDDNVGALFHHPTALGGSATISVGGAIYAGVGPNVDPSSTSFTVGGSFSYSNDMTHGLSAFIDLNGDGLPDKVYKENSDIYFRRQIRESDGQVHFAAPKKVGGSVSDFSFQQSNNFCAGVEAKVKVFSLGVEHSVTHTDTRSYFCDVNGDGLTDIVSNGIVYFNHLEKGIPTFTKNSSKTSNPIRFDATAIRREDETDRLKAEQNMLMTYSPMLDVVRVWQAPREGRVLIHSEVNWLKPAAGFNADEYELADGVRAAVQHASNEVWSVRIEKGDTAVRIYEDSLIVKKGDRLYFRLQCGDDSLSNGSFDAVKWPVMLSYMDEESAYMPDRLPTDTFSSDELVYGGDVWIPVGGTDVTLSGLIQKPTTSDSVSVALYGKIREESEDEPIGVETCLWSHQFTPYDSLDYVLNEKIQLKGNNMIQLRLLSSSNVPWNRWFCDVVASSFDTIQRQNRMIPYFKTYAKQLVTPSVVETDTVWKEWRLLPLLSTEHKNFTGTLTLTAKTIDSLKCVRSYSFNNDSLLNSVDTARFQTKDENVWLEFTYDGYLTMNFDTLSLVRFADSIMKVQKKISPDSVVTIDSVVYYRDTLQVGLSCLDAGSVEGRCFRGWGSFVYNSSCGRCMKPIDESLLIVPSDTSYRYDPLTTAYQQMMCDPDTFGRLRGSRAEVYVQGDRIGTSRLSQQSVLPVSAYAGLDAVSLSTNEGEEGTAAGALIMKTKSSCTIETASAIVNASRADGEVETEAMMMDFNGDGYPDYLVNGTIYYTNAQGGFSRDQLQVASVQSWAYSNSLGLGSGKVPCAHPSSKTGTNDGTSSQGEQNNCLAWSALVGGGNNHDGNTTAYVDLNGDGLPDLLYCDRLNEQNNKVSYNLGYSFSAPVPLGIDAVREGSASFDKVAGGVSFDYNSSSVSGGLSGSYTDNRVEKCLIDVNGDGLPDQLTLMADQVMVSLNTGDGFAAPEKSSVATDISRTISHSEGINASFTANIPIWVIKLSLNPSVRTATSVSSPRFEFRDVDGDGYVDMVSSEKEEDLRVRYAMIGKCNKLKRVQNSLGGSFTLDYGRTEATVDHPGGKWVMSSLEVNDGVSDDGPVMRTHFLYAGGRRDRRERRFLGFAEVRSIDVNTEKKDAPYRQSVQFYDVSDVYAAGRLLKDMDLNANGDTLVLKENEYQMYSVSSANDFATKNYIGMHEETCHFYQFLSGYPSNRWGVVYMPLSRKRSYQFEGTSKLLLTTEKYDYHLDQNHHGEVKRYSFTDETDHKGYVTEIDYVCRSAYYQYGLPSEVKVYDDEGMLCNHTTAKYGPTLNYPIQDLIRVCRHLGADSAVTEMQRGRYGNITKMTLPENVRKQRKSYSYAYDDERQLFVSSVRDNEKIENRWDDYDHLWGIAGTRQDANHQFLTTETDHLGRITQVKSPSEVTDAPYTIAFSYHPVAKLNDKGEIERPAYAVTRHFDNQHPENPIETFTFVDGFGKILQIKQESELNVTDKGEAMQSGDVFVVSGRVKKDAFGRVVEQYAPVTVPLSDSLNFVHTFDATPPAEYHYDCMNRLLAAVQPDGSVTHCSYSVDEGYLKRLIMDGNGHCSAELVNGRGKVKATLRGNGFAIRTRFSYDGVGRLTEVEDAEGNRTYYEYDMGGRCTLVNHPARGKTSYRYDVSGNLLSRQTAALAGKGEQITYEYDYDRLTAIHYPEHPQNDVRYVYGDCSAMNGCIGRLAHVADGSGVLSYAYGKSGEVVRTTRTMVVPTRAEAMTFTTHYQYDSHGRMQHMVYPDGEKVSYKYDLGGHLQRVLGSTTEDGTDNLVYIDRMTYDRYGHCNHRRLGDGSEETMHYDENRRFSALQVKQGDDLLSDVLYGYDGAGNILSVNDKRGVHHTYGYDYLDRLVSAQGHYTGGEASYALEMSYDPLGRLLRKQQTMEQQDIQFKGEVRAGYDLGYHYKGFQLDTLLDSHYRTDSLAAGRRSDYHTYAYDLNGNPTEERHFHHRKNGRTTQMGVRYMQWDEENRLTHLCEDGRQTAYYYDHAGERTAKVTGMNQESHFDGADMTGQTSLRYTLYPSQYITYSSGGRYTKHIYAGSQRVASVTGEELSDPSRVVPHAGTEGSLSDTIKVDFAKLYKAQTQVFDTLYPMYEVRRMANDSDGFVRRQEPQTYFYHSDHLGSTTLVTSQDGQVQQVSYMPYGEVFLEKRNKDWNTPYLFNGKEQDEESGLFYYGARYYDARRSLWLSVDPLAEIYPETSAYMYCAGNPVKLVDPDGREVKNSYQEEYQRLLERYEARQISMKSKYGDDFKNKNRENFSSKQAYKGYRDELKQYKNLEKKFKITEENYNKINEYMENYKRIDPDAFSQANVLTYTIEGEEFNYDIYLMIDPLLYETGGAMSKICQNDKTGVYYGVIYLSPTFSVYDNRLAHEFGHNVQFASNPVYWTNHIDSNLNCQKNPNHPQAKAAMEWQKRWDEKCNKLGR